MASKAHEHLEHAEHSQHAAHDPFDRRVAISMAIIAAVLAGLGVLGHRKHNEVLRVQAEANNLQTEANILHTEATDQWALYQAKNIRSHTYQSQRELLDAAAKDPARAADAAKARARMTAQIEKYEADLPREKAAAEKLVADGRRKQRQSQALADDVHHAHAQADRLDVAHLLAEIGLVVCSIALLTKRKAYWLAGVAAAVLAIGTGASAFVLPKHEHHSAADADAPAGTHPHAPDAGGHP